MGLGFSKTPSGHCFVKFYTWFLVDLRIAGSGLSRWEKPFAYLELTTILEIISKVEFPS